MDKELKKVCVLLSTYNGERYLEEQLCSLEKQESVELQVLIRDDGSSDETLQILQKWAQRDSRFSYYSGANKGPAKSFLDLVVNSCDADYYAFCDQDDVWDSDKLAVAIKHLDKEDNSRANMYHSDLRVVDRNLEHSHLFYGIALQERNKYSCLTEDVVTGCTIVFNSKTKEYVKCGIPDYCSMHDTWIYMICMFFGKVVYDPVAHISYRQHGGNVLGAYPKGGKYKQRWVSFKRLFDPGVQARYKNANSFYKLYKNCLSAEDRAKLEIFVGYKDSLPNKMRLLFDKDIHPTLNRRALRFRIMVILGTV